MVSTAGEVEGSASAAGSDVLPPGAKAGPWIVERELGRGGMGAVYAVVHDEIGKRAALKVVHTKLLMPGFNPDRMLLEARVVNQVGHPNIVDIFETGKLPDGRPYIVMERLEGQPLAHRADDGKLLADMVIAILLQVCDALIAAHAAGIVHRDLKLDNVFLVDNADEPNTPKVKLLDWGIAKVINHDVKHTVEGQLVGTPQYLAPEQARGAAVSPQTDVYSLGVMAYELFLEQLPFEAETSAEIMAMHLRVLPPPPSELWPDIPAPLERLLLDMLAKKPDDRPTMLEVARRLEAVRAHLHARRDAISEGSGAIPVAPGASERAIQPGEVPMARRLVSSPGFASTEPPEWQTGTRRWQYVVGGVALAASAAMYIISRSGDSAASTSASLHGAAAHVPHVEADVVTVRSSPAPVAVPHAVAPEPAAAPAAAPVRSAAPTRTSSRSTSVAHRSSSRTDPVAPRRATKIDPDGTVDPYR